DPSMHEFSDQLRQSIHLILGPAVYNRQVLALDKPGVFEALAESAQALRDRVRCGVEEPNDWHHRLLRARRERPCSHRATEQRDELAAFQLGKLHPVPQSQGQSITDW